jgi:hypothetical protein
MNSDENETTLMARKPVRVRGWMLVLISICVILIILFMLEAVLGLFGVRTAVRYRPVSSPDLFAHDDTLGWVLRPGAEGRLISHEFSVLYTVNRFGMRSTPDSKIADSPQILCLGGSMTFGHGLNDDQTIPNRLADLSGKSVWNLGVQGYATDQSLIQLRRVLRTSRPDIVILSYLPSHIERNASLAKWTSKLEISHRGKPRFRMVDGGLLLAKIPGAEAPDSAHLGIDDEELNDRSAGFFLASGNG